MSFYAIGRSVQGASHESNGKVCQDAQKITSEGEALIVSVADGHGSDACLYSEEGSKTATETFCDCMRDLCKNYENRLDDLGVYLYKEGSVYVARRLVRDWQERIKDRHKEANREFPKQEDDMNVDEQKLFRYYGTTLLGMLITPKFHFAFQIGDGNITEVIRGEASEVITTEQILGVETHSLCENEPWKYVHTVVRHLDEDQFAYLLSTDGFKNSHATEDDYLKSCREYVGMISEYGSKAVEKNLEDWLIETSKEGCGDDITVVIVTNYDKPVIQFVIEEEIDEKRGNIKKHGKVIDQTTGEIIQDDVLRPERNDPCPCGSGKKYKRCCFLLQNDHNDAE